MNTVGAWKTTVRTTDPERRAWWLEMTGCEELPILSIIPVPACLPGHPKTAVYLLDVDALTEEQRSRLVSATAKKFGVTVEEVEVEILDHGYPILAEDATALSWDAEIMGINVEVKLCLNGRKS